MRVHLYERDDVKTALVFEKSLKKVGDKKKKNTGMDGMPITVIYLKHKNLESFEEKKKIK